MPLKIDEKHHISFSITNSNNLKSSLGVSHMTIKDHLAYKNFKLQTALNIKPDGLSLTPFLAYNMCKNLAKVSVENEINPGKIGENGLAGLINPDFDFSTK